MAGPVVSTAEIPLDDAAESDDELTRCYGYEIVTEHPTFGEVTCVFSFRNDSNGYYGGSLVGPLGAKDTSWDGVIDGAPVIKGDVLECWRHGMKRTTRNILATAETGPWKVER